MPFLRRLSNVFTLSDLEPDVMVSQITAFSRQIPLLYVIGNVNSVALAYTHFDTAPKFLTLLVPIPMFLICLIRIVVWARSRARPFAPEGARARLRSTIVMTTVMGAIYAAWALCLYPYGDAYARCHVAFFMSITVIGTIFCLMHLRPAALLLTGIVTIPFVIRFTTTGQPVLTAIAINFLLVDVIMIFILFTYYRDFSNLVRSEKALISLSDENFRLANLDSLTALPNRRSFFRDAAALLEAETASARVFAFGIIDLDGFKPVNDVHGHAAGDQVLIEVGRRLRATLGATACVARLGGDEFGLILDVTDDPAAILSKGVDLCAALAQPIRLASGTARVAGSVGLTYSGPDASSLELLIERADYALYTAKARHRGTAVMFSASHEDAIRARSRMDQALSLADFDAEMTMTFQPIVDVSDDRIVAYEALARWTSPQLGAVPPQDFIAAAERTGLMNALTAVLFGKALEALATWPEPIGLSFNLSVHDVASIDLMLRVQTMLRASGLRASRIAFEITETALIQEFEPARKALLVLTALGARIVLDDFGTGYSSLHYIHRLPFDSIKVDRSFVADIAADSVSRKIVKSVLDLCRNLDITCVVEGVETAEQTMILRSLGCRTMQGYVFGRPAAACDLQHTTIGQLARSA